MRYIYTAVNAQNKKGTGIINAIDKTDAISQLQDRGLVALEIRGDSGADSAPTSVMEKEIFTVDIHKTKIKKKDLLNILNQMGIMMKAGVSLSMAMDVLINGTKRKKDKKVQAILMGINSELYSGTPISVAMAKFNAFPDIIINIIQSGEANGRLDTAFERSASIVESELSITTKIRGAMGYPIFLLCLTIVLMIILNTLVLPKFVDLFSSFHAKLPALTIGVMAVSSFLIHQWYVLIIVVVAIIVGFHLLRKYSYGFNVKFDEILLRIPVIGTVLRQSYLARFCRIMSSLVEAGVDIVHSLEIARDVIPNRCLKSDLTQVIDDVKVGTAISQAMAKFPIFDILLISMLKVGEESGLLYETMEKLATLYETQTAESTKRLTAMLEPAMTIIIAGIVGTVVISIVMPMFGLYSVILK